MARQFSLPQNCKIEQLTAPVTTNGGVNTRRVNLANAHKAWIVVELQQAAGVATTVTLEQATAITGGTTAVGPTSAFNWLNDDTAAGDSLTRGTAGNAVTVANNVKQKQVVFEVDPIMLTSGYQYIYVNVADSSQATNFVSATAYLYERFQQATPPAANA